MSAFGGDSWAREAQYRKRRVDDLMLSSSSSSSNYKKLSNGKFACLVCPHNPVLDSPLALSMHAKGSRHIAAVSRLKEKELSRREELNKRIALSSDSVAASTCSPPEQAKETKVRNQPLIEQTRKAILEIQCNRSWERVGGPISSSQKLNTVDNSCDPKISSSSHIRGPPEDIRLEQPPESTELRAMVVTEPQCKMLVEWNNQLHKRREKELKFISAGWKRDGFGKWYRDENVEFDSDEEDPNDSLD